MPFSLTIYGAHFLRLAIRIQAVENRFLIPRTLALSSPRNYMTKTALVNRFVTH